MNRITSRVLVLSLLSVLSISFLIPPRVCADAERHHLKPLHHAMRSLHHAMRSLDSLDALLSDSAQAVLNFQPEQIALMRKLRERNVSVLCTFYHELQGRDEHEEGESGEDRSMEDLITAIPTIRRDMMMTMTASQRLRFRELLLRAIGWSSLLDEGVLKAMEQILGLTPEQMDSLADLRHEIQRRAYRDIPATDGDIATAISQIREQEQRIMDAINPRVKELLTAEQREILQRMIGEQSIADQSLPLRTTGNPLQSCAASSGG